MQDCMASDSTVERRWLFPGLVVFQLCHFLVLHEFSRLLFLSAISFISFFSLLVCITSSANSKASFHVLLESSLTLDDQKLPSFHLS